MKGIDATKLTLSSLLLFVLVLSSGVGTAQNIPQSGWKLQFVDSQETTLSCSNGFATNAFDGNSSTIWHTQWCPSSPPLPHEIQIDLGLVYNLTSFSYLPRQDGCGNGWIRQYEFYVSQDGTNWGTPVASGTFNYGTATFTCPGAPVLPAIQVPFATTSGRYIRLRALSEVNGNPWTAVAELNVTGTVASNQPPNGTITSPSSTVTITAGSTVIFSGSGADPDNNLPLTYLWTFGAGSGIPNSSQQNPGTIQFNNPGTYTVTFTVTDALGLSDPTPATRTVTVLSNSSSSIPQSGWKLQFVDSQETTLSCSNGFATNAFDGNSSTIWHTQWCPSSPPLPHEIQIDLGLVYNLTSFSYLPRQDGCAHGWISQYEFYVSQDGVNYDQLLWNTPVASGIFNYGSAVATCPTTSIVNAQQVSFPPTPGRFVRFRALSEVNDSPWTSAAEINVTQGCTTTPSVLLGTPRSELLQTSSTLTVIANACLSAGYGLRFMLDGGSASGGSQIDLYSAPWQVQFGNVSAAEHQVDVYVIDGNGVIVAGTATHDHASNVAIGDYYVAMGDSITFGRGDDYPNDDVSTDSRNRGGGYTPVLNNSLTTFRLHPQNIANEAVPGTGSADGVALIPQVLARHPNAQMFLVQYGTNDSPGLASGAGLNPGNAGYSGSFKDHMQQIITAINNAAKKVALAKIPIALADCGGLPDTCTPYPNPTTAPKNLVIQQYNQAIDELVSANRITVVPPDFYTYFSAHYTTEYADYLHPNGIGYQSTARMWFQALTQ